MSARKHSACLRGLALLVFLETVLPPSVYADWPMPGHDVRRTSAAPEDAMAPCNTVSWVRPMAAYIPSRSQIITVQGSTPSADRLYVTTAEGIVALEPATGNEVWRYAMTFPPGDSPTVADGVLYVASLDRTIHAVNAQSGSLLWKTDEAGAPFYVNPLVVNGRVYAGSRDGYFYSFNAANGQLNWYYQVGAPIAYSAAYQQYSDVPGGVIFFAAHNSRAYALRADTGALLWETAPLPADRFTSYWPVITGERVLFASSTHYPAKEMNSLQVLQRAALYADAAQAQSNLDSQGLLNLQNLLSYNLANPERRTLFVLNRQTGQQAEVAPVLWWGNNSGQRYPPVIDSQGRVIILTPWIDSWFGTGRYIRWSIGSAAGRPIPHVANDLESADEPEAASLIGSHLYHNDGGDGVDKGGAFDTASANSVANWQSYGFFLRAGAYWGTGATGWLRRKYGNNLREPTNYWTGSTGLHGHQNPPVPLRGRVYFHRSNAVICMEP